MERKEVHIRILDTAKASLNGTITREQMEETMALCQKMDCMILLHRILFDVMQSLTIDN